MVTERRIHKLLDESPWPSTIPAGASKLDENEARFDGFRPPSHTPGPGFLGSTSFSAVYREEKSLDDLPNGSPSEGTAHGPAKRLYVPNRESQVIKGTSCLAAFVEHQNLGNFIEHWQQLYDCVSTISPFTSALSLSVGTYLYGAIAQAQGNEVEKVLKQKSAEIYRNSLEEFAIPPGCTIEKYGSMLADPSKLRWDTLGLYFTAVGLGASHWNQGASRAITEARRGLAKKMLEASDTCISLCEELGQMTDAEVFLYCENAHLSSIIEGDASKLRIKTAPIVQIHHKLTPIP
jgi:hypothetical protein